MKIKMSNQKLTPLIEFKNLKNHIQKNILVLVEKEFINNFSNIDEERSKKIHKIVEKIMDNLKNWMNDEIPEKYKKYVITSIKKEKWTDVIEAFKEELTFGTSGIRGKLVVSLNENECYRDLKSLNNSGFNSEILRGTNSINEITIMKNIFGLIKYMQNEKYSKVVIGYDSRVCSHLFSRLITDMFLQNNFFVILFDESNSLPELSFAVTHFNADIGIEITASHNDKRYNGYKIITKLGSPPPTNLREKITKEIFNNSKNIPYNILNIFEKDIKNYDSKNLLIINNNIDNIQNFSREKLNQLYLKQIINLISNKEIIEQYSSKINFGYSALHGTGYNSTLHLCKKMNIKNVKYISNMILPNVLFPSFSVKQILDPSDKNTSNVIVDLFTKEFGLEKFNDIDFLCYTDPDADRLGIVVPTIKNEQSIYGSWKLLNANDVWTLFLWYMLEILSKKNNSFFSKIDKSFIVKSFVTSDSLLYISKKYNLECIDSKVGFSDITSIVLEKWKNNLTNIGMFEESCGFGLAGNSTNPYHILEKDGIMSLALFIEIVAFLKSKNMSIQNILNTIYQDPEIGFFVNNRRELPEKDVFEGINGELILQKILRNVEKLYEVCIKQINLKQPKLICGLPITKVTKFSTGRYDERFWKKFSDEGIRFTLNSPTNHITIRSSGTEPKIRIFVQYRITDLNKDNLLRKKLFGEQLVKKISNEIENLIKI
jgi:phosphoglucomutase